MTVPPAETRMTLEEFFRQARRFTWAINAVGEVRCARGFCPLGAVGYKRKRTPEAAKAAKRLRLDPWAAGDIAWGADYPTSARRRWLLENLGMNP